MDKQVDVVGGGDVVEDRASIALLRLKEPGDPLLTIPGKLEEELLLVAPVGDVPAIARDVVPVGSGHPVKPSIHFLD